MSRFLLALKVCLSQVGGTTSENGMTMVFDEIDTGVSGRVTQAIAEKLYQLASPLNHGIKGSMPDSTLHPQVLCVTHQPILAAMADAHFQVKKTIIQESSESDSNQSGERTVVRVSSLTGNDRKQELAQLAGGKTDGDAIAFAESLLTQAETVRNQLHGGQK